MKRIKYYKFFAKLSIVALILCSSTITAFGIYGYYGPGGPGSRRFYGPYDNYGYYRHYGPHRYYIRGSHGSYQYVPYRYYRPYRYYMKREPYPFFRGWGYNVTIQDDVDYKVPGKFMSMNNRQEKVMRRVQDADYRGMDVRRVRKLENLRLRMQDVRRDFRNEYEAYDRLFQTKNERNIRIERYRIEQRLVNLNRRFEQYNNLFKENYREYRRRR